jgi:hypothetical protein
MAFNPVPVREARLAARYDGTNSAELNNAITSFAIVSENAQGLTFTSGGQQYTVAPNGFVAWYQGEVTEVFQNENDYNEVYAGLSALESHVHDLILTTGPAKPAEDENA